MSDHLAQLLEKAVATSFLGESMMLTQDWDDQRLGSLIALAELFAELDKRGIKTPLCPSELAYAMFFDNSTRTKSAWAGAATRLGMSPVIVDGSSTQVSHGETAAETGAMLGMNSHALGVRHDLILGEGNSFMRDVKQGIDEYLAATDDPRKVPIVNLQCDIDHPTQATADLLWLRERFPEGLAGKKIAMSWAYSPSYAKPLSVPQGIITLMTRFGADVTLAHPEGYQLIPDTVAHAAANAKASGGSFRVTDNMDDAFEGADVVYPKSWGPYDLMLERVAANKARDKAAMADIEHRALARNKQYTDWICDERRMAKTAGGDALYMHCLPADIGDEVTPGVMDLHKVNVAREAQKKVYVIMALLAGAKLPDLKERLSAYLP
ncbi:MAG: knotted carbamoyltransferase YgeW [Deltaproteobacteria bacterium]|nr:MAG: knotted carbamoyltransferase YgeW [Deltaproteobacteria bacterium]